MKAAGLARHGMMAVMLGTALSAIGPSASADDRVSPIVLRDLGRYCTACWRNAGVSADRWDDCTQEALCQLMQRIPVGSWHEVLKGPEEKRREFVRVIDLVKKRVRREKRTEILDPYAVADRRDGDQRSSRELREAVSTAAEKLLSARQRDILARTADGYSVTDIAEEFELSAQRISDEKYKAIRKLSTYFQAIS